MIVDFTVENYRSYRDRTTFSMVAEEPTYHEENVDTLKLADGTSIRLLRFAGIFGANASGKSNVIFGLDTMSRMVINSMNYNQYNKIDTYDPYLFSNDKDLTYFCVTFIQRRRMYRYEFHYNSDMICDERLSLIVKGESNVIYDVTLDDIGKRLSISEEAPKLRKEVERLIEPEEDGNYRMSRYQLFMSLSFRFVNTELLAAHVFFRRLFVYPINSVISLDVSKMLSEDIFRQTSRSRTNLQQLVKLISVGDLGIDGVEMNRYNKDDFRFPSGISDEDTSSFIKSHIWE